MPPIVMISHSRMPNDHLKVSRGEAVLSDAADIKAGPGLLVRGTILNAMSQTGDWQQ